MVTEPAAGRAAAEHSPVGGQSPWTPQASKEEETSRTKHKSQRETVAGSKDKEVTCLPGPVSHPKVTRIKSQGGVMVKRTLNATRRGQTIFEWRGTRSELCLQNLDLATGRRRGEGQENSACPT